MKKSPSIKICGITRAADAITACDLGADYIGVVLVPQSPRCVSIEAAREIRKAVERRARTVLVFKNQDIPYIEYATRFVGADLVQLHGQEPAALLRQLSLPVIKTFEYQVTTHSTNERLLLTSGGRSIDLSCYEQSDFILIDRPKELNGRKATAMSEVASLLSEDDLSRGPVFLAGGITPENAGSILNAVKRPPFGLDVCSGVETSTGIKSRLLLEQLFQTSFSRKEITQ